MPKNEEIEEMNDKIIGNEIISEKISTEEKKTSKMEKDTKNKTDSEVAEKKALVEDIDKENVIDNKAETPKKQVDETTVIEKIKSFIAKIAAMQEEARKEMTEEKNSKNLDKEKVKSEKQEKNETKKIEYMLEYYDLPYRYNETIVKILAQTPKRLFVYWDISDNDRDKYIKTFGNDFFEKTYPVLLLYNEDKKYVREIPINDFANSWYIEIQDSKTKYTIQLGRKFKEYSGILNINMQKVQENNIILHTDYLPFANSNILEVPNDHVLLEKLPTFITFRNVKTNQEVIKELRSFKDVFGSNYSVKEFYENNYKDELSEGMFDMANPSSKLSSSSFK